jgi:serine/threonine protein phosphatase PrpC
MSAHFVSLKGDRNSNEDNHNIILGLNDNNVTTAKVNYYGIYDGHGGKFVSNFLSENIYHFFIDKKVKYPLDKTYVNSVYDKLQNVLFTKHEKEALECGSTCLVVCHFKDTLAMAEYLNIINTGDSRCVLCRNNIAQVLTKDHKPDWPDEHARISKLGGEVRKDGNTYRINDLSVSRAFGDKESSKYVTHRPDMYKYKISDKDRFLIIACDGLWDVMASQDAINFVLINCYDSDMKRINPKINIARKLAEYAIEHESGDNVTCIVVFFDK